MNTTERIVNCLNDKLSEYKQPVAILSKSDKNFFVTDNTIMFDWDEISKLYGGGDESSSVDAIYCSIENSQLTLYFFEFKNHNLFDSFFDPRKLLEEYIEDLENCVFCCCFPKKFRDVKKKLISKKIISLKTKPIESLILLHDILNEDGISSENIIKVKKEYYIVSNTPVTWNKSNSRRHGRTGEIFGFVDKISPFPFVHIEPINEKTFLSLIKDLEMKNELNN